MPGTGAATTARTTVLQPLEWWRIARRRASSPAEGRASALPFLRYFQEGGAAWEEDEMPGELKDRVAVPIAGWPEAQMVGRWGGDTRLIEDWFSAGEELQHCTTELLIEEPDRWERAFSWMRSLAVATR